MRDDELRDRLHAMPEPSTSIDVEAVVADARRRRRPKVVGVAVASVAGCLALLSPVVLPALLPTSATTATMQEAGVAEQGTPEDGQAPAAPDGGDASDPSVLGQPVPTGPRVAACDAVPVSQVAPTVRVGVRDDDGDGIGSVLVENLGDAPIDVAVGDVGLAIVSDGAPAFVPDVQPASVEGVAPTTLQPSESATFDATLLPAESSCLPDDVVSEGGEILDAGVGVVALAIDGVTFPQPLLER